MAASNGPSDRVDRDGRALLENSIPLLDLSRFDAAKVKERAAFLSELRDAARQTGFFYITGHGIEPALLNGLMNSARHFFSLPEPDKLAVEMVNSPHFRGYTRIAWERTRGLQDWRDRRRQAAIEFADLGLLHAAR
jgi:isopenicillin N synthase-like dioxygenase